MTPPQIRVVVVDDHPLVRAGLRVLLSDDAGTELVGEAADGARAIELVRELRPDVVLMDVRMPVLDEYVFEALQAGASGFLLKDASPADLLRAVHVVAAGESMLAPSVTRRLIEHFARRGPAGPSAVHPQLASLTEREREIVAWVATGRSNDEIAEELVVSPATVRTHVSRAMTKLHARDRAQLVVFAVRAGLPLPD